MLDLDLHVGKYRNRVYRYASHSSQDVEAFYVNVYVNTLLKS